MPEFSKDEGCRILAMNAHWNAPGQGGRRPQSLQPGGPGWEGAGLS